MDPRFDLRPHTSAQSSLNPSTGHMHAYNINLLWGCLVCDFKQPFSVFKQNFTYFNVLFHSHVFSQIFLMILGKITTLCSSMRGRPDLRPQHMEVRTRKLVLSRAGRTKFQVSSSLAKPRPDPARQWIVQTRHWTSHLSVIDKVDGNRCQRRLDELGQTIRC